MSGFESDMQVLGWTITPGRIELRPERAKHANGDIVFGGETLVINHENKVIIRAKWPSIRIRGGAFIECTPAPAPDPKP